MFPKRERVYLEMQAHVHLRVWEGGGSYPRNVASAASASLATPAETSIIWTLNFISSIIYNICNNSVIPQGVKGTYQFSFFLHFKLQAEVQTISDFNCCSRLCIFYAGRHFQKLFKKSIKGLTCIPILLTAIMQSVRRFPWLSLKSAKFCWLTRRCALQLPSGLGHGTQSQKGGLMFSPQWNICLKNVHMLENIFINCNILSRW